MREVFGDSRVLIVGLGGLGCPVALALASAGVGTLGLVDDDVVELTNLHRQVLFDASMLGTLKINAASRVLERRGSRFHLHPTRFVPENAIDLVEHYDLLVDATDNYATKFLLADVARKKKKPIVHASAERWSGFVLSVGDEGAPCYRCVFEDIPSGPQRNCNDTGVVGASLGVIGAVQADLALRLLTGDRAAAGLLFQFDGLSGKGRSRYVSRRSTCPLCAAGDVSIERGRYIGQTCELF